MSHQRTAWWAKALLLATGIGAVFAPACDAPDTASPVSPSVPSPLSIEIAGPDTLAPGQAAQYTALVRLSDGTVKSLWEGAGAHWNSGSPAVTVNDAGLATGSAPGESVLSVAFGTGIRGSRDVVVVPDGTFRLVGMVTDAEFPALGIPGALVEAVPGPGAAVTDATGRYRLYGVPPQSELRVTAAGYAGAVQSVSLAGHGVRDVALTLSGPRQGAFGSYTLSIDFLSPCSSLAPALQHRTYSAFVAQVGPQVDVTLLSPSFRRDASGRGDRFSGTVTGGTATFVLDDPYYYFYYAFFYPSVAEQLSDGSVLSVSGRVTTSVGPGGFIGNTRGALTHWVPPRSFRGSCFGDMRFALTPN